MKIPSSPDEHRQLIRQKLATDLITNPENAAQKAGLRYVSDSTPGLTRKRWGRGFSYFDENCDRIQDEDILERLKSLNIPPAWEDVWICPNPDGHLQSTGRDERGRKQYRYHDDWQELRSRAKFDRLVPFGLALPLIRQQCDRNLRQTKLTREKVVAIVVRLLDETLIRVGNSEYAQQNSSYGLTTLRDRHVEIFSNKIRFEFTGKRGIHHEIELRDRRLARAVKRCRDIPGYELFQYFDDDDNRQTIDSGDVNHYLQSITGQAFTAKEFRTWTGTVETAVALQEMGEAQSETEAKRNIVSAVKQTAKKLGNRPATCRKYYIHPLVIEAYQSGQLIQQLNNTKPKNKAKDDLLDPEERSILSFLDSVSR
ncbi:MAG: DNA topoisomerase IB [Thainema sp.]